MLRRMTVRNLTVFSDEVFEFGRNLTVIVGENGTGKTHLLKAAYSLLAASWEEGRKPNAPSPTRVLLQPRLAEKLIAVFRPESLGRLASRRQGRARCEIGIECEPPQANVAFSFATNSKKEVDIEVLPKAWIEGAPAYFPTRELLTIYPNFLSVYENHYLEFDETWRDTCRLLGSPARRGPRLPEIAALLNPLEAAMGGNITLDPNGRFYLRIGQSYVEMPLVSEGLRKFGMLAHLIGAGTLLSQGYLFWDEPEANLNPRLVAKLAEVIVQLSAAGVQTFIATHSLFLMREIEMLLDRRKGDTYDARFIGLHAGEGAVSVRQGLSINDIGDISSLDEELAQSDRYLTADL